jgi:hypothetical protein
MNKKVKSGVFIFDENVAHVEYENKNVDKNESKNENKSTINKDKKTDFVSEILKEDPFFLSS